MGPLQRRALPAAVKRAVLGQLQDYSCPRKPTHIENLLNKLSRLPLIRPERSWVLIWHLVVIFSIVWYLFEVGLLLAFGNVFWQSYRIKTLPLHLVLSMLLLGDIWLNFNKAFYEDGHLVRDRLRIVKRYEKVRVWIDLGTVGVILMSMVISSIEVNWLKAIFFVKAYYLWQINKELQVCIRLNTTAYMWYLATRLLVIMLLCCHYIGVGFYMLDVSIYSANLYGSATPLYCWTYTVDAFYQLILVLDWSQQWIYLLYFSIGMTTTIAYGDITPRNSPQCVYIVFALIFDTFLFGYILAEILRIFILPYDSNFAHQMKVQILQDLIKEPCICNQSGKSIQSHLQSIFHSERNRNRFHERNAISRLPISDQGRLYSQANVSLLNSLNLRLHPSSDFLIALSSRITEMWCIEGSYLYQQGHMHDQQHVFYCFAEQSRVELGLGQIKIRENVRCAGKQTFLRGGLIDHWAFCHENAIALKVTRGDLLACRPTMNQSEIEQLSLVKELQDCLICEGAHPKRQCTVFTVPKRPAHLAQLSRLMRRNYCAMKLFKTIRQDAEYNEDQELPNEGGLENFDSPYQTCLYYPEGNLQLQIRKYNTD